MRPNDALICLKLHGLRLIWPCYCGSYFEPGEWLWGWSLIAG
jgi:hypothetical protein